MGNEPSRNCFYEGAFLARDHLRRAAKRRCIYCVEKLLKREHLVCAPKRRNFELRRNLGFAGFPWARQTEESCGYAGFSAKAEFLVCAVLAVGLLYGAESVIFALFCHQFIVCSKLYNSVVVYNRNLVGVLYRRKPVRDNQRCAAF